MSQPIPLIGRRPEPHHPHPCLRSAPCSLSPTAAGTTTPAPGPRGPGAGTSLAARQPSRAELQAIEAEWPLIEAEVALVDAECHYLIRPSATTRAAVRAAEAAVIRAHLAHTRNHPPSQGAAA